jgi:hypothetical protein
MSKEDVDKEVRALLRTSIDALRALDKFCDPDDGFAEQHRAVGWALEYLEDGFPEDVAGKCEGCFNICLYGEMGHRDSEGICLCAECAPDWDDVKEQWDTGREEEEDGQLDRFFAAYNAHIASGGQGTDKILYQL